MARGKSQPERPFPETSFTFRNSAPLRSGDSQRHSSAEAEAEDVARPPAAPEHLNSPTLEVMGRCKRLRKASKTGPLAPAVIGTSTWLRGRPDLLRLLSSNRAHRSKAKRRRRCSVCGAHARDNFPRETWLKISPISIMHGPQGGPGCSSEPLRTALTYFELYPISF